MSSNEPIDDQRRRFLGTAMTAIAASSLGLKPAGAAPATKPTAVRGVGAIKQIDAGVLNIGYAEEGPAGGTPVILLRRCRRCGIRQEVLGPLLAPRPRRHRTQRAARGSRGVRQGDHRRRQIHLTVVGVTGVQQRQILPITVHRRRLCVRSEHSADRLTSGMGEFHLISWRCRLQVHRRSKQPTVDRSEPAVLV
jgi:hypothetical protein